MVKVLEKFLSHFKALEMLRLSCEVVKDNSLRHTISDTHQVTNEIQKVAERLTDTYHLVRQKLEDRDTSSLLVVPDVSNMSVEDKAELKKKLGKAISDIDKSNSEGKQE